MDVFQQKRFIRVYMEVKGFSYQELADFSGYSLGMIKNISSGNTALTDNFFNALSERDSKGVAAVFSFIMGFDFGKNSAGSEDLGPELPFDSPAREEDREPIRKPKTA